MAEQLKTLLEILNYSADLLSKKGVKDSRLNVELLFAHVLSCSRLDLYLNFDKPLNRKEIDDFKSLLKRRLTLEPLQYITGLTNFYGYDIEVNPGVLIPRPDTEFLVEKFLESVKDRDEFNVFEIGTGSGCIAVAIIRELEKMGKNFHYTGIDISDKAVETSISNLSKNKVDNGRYLILKRDFLSNDFSIKKLEDETKYIYTYLISNPPYISPSEYIVLDEEVRKFEPEQSLTDGIDGLVFYRKLFEIDSRITQWLEISYNRKEVLATMLGHASVMNYEFFKDYGGNDRVLRVN